MGEEEKLRKEELKRLKEKQAKRKEIRAEQEKKLAAQKKEEEEKQAASGKGGKAVGGGGGGGGVQDARKEMTKTKEQLEEEKRISLSIRIKPLDVDAMDSDQLSAKAKELWETIVKLETEKYDLEERQKQQLRQKAMKKGLDPEALTGKYPPKIRMYSKYERRTDTRTYEDRRKLYEGGW